ncbi:amino acid permease [Alicyclobacillus sp. SO9]|uniref:amino acid permease n=1 Tax=Alicyclobacillus sp. SO9 TaxID=2665646 RepID=UPI0018E80C4E|nr:amino acid permease [Alicyclobacillus sp. SO9]QQE79621.1 amino acid permease [Alicyclobacillus sp. SO9]
MRNDSTGEVHVKQLRRDLKNRHIQLIALGGAIGTGLFYGSATTIKMVGPGITVSYLLGGLIIFFIMRALGEMSVDEPVSGSFSHYAYRHWGGFPGFLAGWNYWLNYIIVAMAELTAVGAYVQFWWHSAPAWLSALIFWVFITLVNLANVKAYGEFEFWFALIKVVAIIAMILLGLVLVFMRTSHGGTVAGVNNLWIHGGFFPHGSKGFLQSLVVVMFSFGGIELIGITAGEAHQPEKSIPRAINQVIWRILIFYVGALAVILMIYPWNAVGSSGSPFVEIFKNIGIPAAAFILNIVVLTAALSTFNSGLYSNGRMLHGLAVQGNAPKTFLRLCPNGSPVTGILVSAGCIALTVLLNYLFPGKAFMYLISAATIAAIINWTMILLTQLFFRKGKGEATRDLLFKMPFYPASSYVSLAFLALVVVVMAFMSDMRMALYIAPIWIVFLFIAYRIKTSVNTNKQSTM